MSDHPLTYNHDHENDIIFFGRTNFRNQLRKFGIKTDDRRRHMYLIGKTGVGKTTLLENMVLADIYLGHGLGLVDPHGDFAEKIIDYIPEHRINDIVYVNPADMEYPVSFNILETVNEDHKHLIASGLMGVFKKIWPDVWSARMEHIMNMCILSLLENPGNTLLGINRILVDRDFRRKMIVGIKDPVVKAFWITEFEQWQDKFRSEAIAPIQNKVGQFLSTSLIRNIVGQSKSTIVPRDIMDSRKIFIINLAKGRVGEDASRLMGGMLITKMQLSAMERVDIPEPDRQDFYLYIDEFQNFATESFANILSEARKYRLALIMAHQYIEQLEEEVASAVFGNVGTIVSYRVGAGDAEKLAVEFAPRFVEEDLVNLPKFNVYLKLMIDGIASDAFSAQTLPPIAARTGSAQKVIDASRRQYSHKRAEVEQDIVSWSESRPEVPVGSLPEIPAGKPMKQLYEYDCTRCNKHMILPVELDRNRPIYCETCIEIVRAERKAGKPPDKVTPVAPKPAVVEVAATPMVAPVAPAPTVAPAPAPVPGAPKPAALAPAPTPKISETEVITKPVGASVSLSTLNEKPVVTPAAPKTEVVAAEPQKPSTPSVGGGQPSREGEEARRKRRRRRGGGGGGSSSGSSGSSSEGSQGGAPRPAQASAPKPAGDDLFPW
ncbi:MAG: type IV secretion system DNA-binding domain-containing protein [Patescibacteria group bacterium]